ncbi:MAG TPA: hypothetical protein VHX38_27645 [Pseudonocardiaceae bacterium]|jgi:ABC-type multidrug transport system fused ATPase/permease subunit|nr:hypothetical protein [Pseudonocardiaceae bacterium]
MGIYLLGLLWMLGAMLVAAGLMIGVRRYVSEAHRHSGDEAAGRVFTVVAGLEAVLIAFVLISLFDAVGSARAGSYTEADSMVAVYWDANLLPPATATKIQKLVLSYGNTVLNQEWPAMSAGQPLSDTGKSQLDQLHDAIASYVPTTFVEEDRQTQLTNDLSTVFQARQQRIEASSVRVNPLIWAALIVGAVLAVGLTCLFGGDKLWTHVAITCVLAGTVTVLLFAAFQLQDPFSGAVHLNPTAFTAALTQLS